MEPIRSTYLEPMQKRSTAMQIKKKFLLCFLLGAISGSVSAQTPETNAIPPQGSQNEICAVQESRDIPPVTSLKQNESWTSFLPLMADKAFEHGYELPLPFGVGVNFITLKRDIEVKEIRAGFGELQDVTDLVAVDATTDVNTFIARVDAWILPFLNFYVMGGYIENQSDISATFTIPNLGGGNTNITINSTGDLSGTLIGGGITLAAGYADFFLTLDANYSETTLDGVLDETIQVGMYTMRTGWNGKIGKTPLQIWLGGMYWDSERVVKGTVGSIKFEVLQGPADPFNLTLGANVELTKKFHLLAEYAFNFDDLQMMTFGAMYRF
jgi:hypothetical protein